MFVYRTGSDKVFVEQRGGVARLATKINEIREQSESSILMNIGDTFHGGAEAMFSIGNDIVTVINELGVDVGVPGNWDYAYGPMVTNARFGNTTHEDVIRPDYDNLAANATYKIPENITRPVAQNIIKSMFDFEPGEPFLEPTALISKGDIKIGFIGLTSDIVERMHEMMAFNIEFTQGKDAYLSLIDEHASSLKQQGAHLVVVMSELGIHKDWELAKSLETGVVNIFFSAHTHEATFEKLVADNKTIVVEAGNDTLLGEMKVIFDSSYTPLEFEWTLHPITPDITPDSEIAKLVEEVRAPYLENSPNITIPTVTPASGGNMMPSMFSQTLHHGLDKVIGKVDVPLSRRHALENEFNNVYTDLLRAHAKTKLAISPGFRFDSAVIPHEHDHHGESDLYYWQVENTVTLNGEVSVADAYRFFPAPYHLAAGTVTGKRLKEILEENINAVFSANVFEQSGGWVDGLSGLSLEVDLTKSQGERIVSILDNDGNPILDDDELSVAGCARPMDQDAETTLCSYSGFANVENLTDPNNPDETYAAADLFIDVIKSDQFEALEIKNRRNITETSGAKFWPDTQFYQPLEGIQ